MLRTSSFQNTVRYKDLLGDFGSSDLDPTTSQYPIRLSTETLRTCNATAIFECFSILLQRRRL